MPQLVLKNLILNVLLLMGFQYAALQAQEDHSRLHITEIHSAVIKNHQLWVSYLTPCHAQLRGFLVHEVAQQKALKIAVILAHSSIRCADMPQMAMAPLKGLPLKRYKKIIKVSESSFQQKKWRIQSPLEYRFFKKNETPITQFLYRRGRCEQVSGFFINKEFNEIGIITSRSWRKKNPCPPRLARITTKFLKKRLLAYQPILHYEAYYQLKIADSQIVKNRASNPNWLQARVHCQDHPLGFLVQKQSTHQIAIGLLVARYINQPCLGPRYQIKSYNLQNIAHLLAAQRYTAYNSDFLKHQRLQLTPIVDLSFEYDPAQTRQEISLTHSNFCRPPLGFVFAFTEHKQEKVLLTGILHTAQTCTRPIKLVKSYFLMPRTHNKQDQLVKKWYPFILRNGNFL